MCICGDFCMIAFKEVGPQNSANCAGLSYPEPLVTPVNWLLCVIHFSIDEGLLLLLPWKRYMWAFCFVFVDLGDVRLGDFV